MSTGKVLTIVGIALAVIGFILMAIGGTVPAFIFYTVLTFAGIGIWAVGKKMEDREADARFNSGR